MEGIIEETNSSSEESKKMLKQKIEERVVWIN